MNLVPMKKLWKFLRSLFRRKKTKTHCLFSAVPVYAYLPPEHRNAVLPILFKRPTPEQFRDFIAKADRGDDKADALLLARHALNPIAGDKLADNPENQ